MLKFQLFLDADGVLADFDVVAEQVFGMNPRKFEEEFGSEEFWKKLRETEKFYENLPLMPDAQDLWDAVSHLEPIILTGCPRGGWAEPQKFNWAKNSFGENAKIITCASREKREHMHQDKHNIIIDDWPQYKPLWEQNGGTFILHTSTNESLLELDNVLKIL